MPLCSITKRFISKQRIYFICLILILLNIKKTLRNIEYEVKILNVMRHRNIIHLIDTFYEPELPEIYLAFENCHYSIKDICDMNNTASNRRKLLPEFIANGLARPGMDALEFVHSKGCIHRNVKPSNFLINCKVIFQA